MSVKDKRKMGRDDDDYNDDSKRKTGGEGSGNN